MKKIIIALLAAVTLSAVASAQTPKDIYYTVQERGTTWVYNANAGTRYSLDGYACDIGIDDSHNVYVLCGKYEHIGYTYTVYKNKEVYQVLREANADKQFYSSMAMKVVGNNVVVAGVESLYFNSKGYSSRMVGYVNGIRIYQTEWERKSLKRDQFKGFCEIKGSGRNTHVVQASNYNSISLDPDSIVYLVKAVDYVNGDIYTTGWGEREYTETPVGYQKQYLVRRCPRVWKNGKEIVQQYENRTGAANNINVMRAGTNILTSGHMREHMCGWDGSKDMITTESAGTDIMQEAVIFNGMVDGAPLFTRMFLDNLSNLYYVNTGKEGNRSPILAGGQKKYAAITVLGDDFYLIRSSDHKIVRISCSNWMMGNFSITDIAEAPISGYSSYKRIAVHK